MNTHLLWTGESFITHSFAARFMRYFVSFLYLVDNIGSLWRGRGGGGGEGGRGGGGGGEGGSGERKGRN